MCYIRFVYALPTLNVKTDISYAVYIYHMIVINIMIEVGLTSSWIYALREVALSNVLGWFSIITIVKIAIKRKNRI